MKNKGLAVASTLFVSGTVTFTCLTLIMPDLREVGTLFRIVSIAIIIICGVGGGTLMWRINPFRDGE